MSAPDDRIFCGPLKRAPRQQRPFPEMMGGERYRRALREEARSGEASRWLADHLIFLLFQAYKKARQTGRNSYAQVRFEQNLSANLDQLCRELLAGTYRPQRCMIFIVTRPVRREVIAPAFRDQVVDHLLYEYLSPIFEKRFIYDSYSCRKGKGTSVGIARLEHHIRSVSENYTKPAWVLQLDLRGYFMSIDHNILYDRVASILRKAGCRKEPFYPLAMYLTRVIVYTDPTVNCFIRGKDSDWSLLPVSKSYFHCKAGTGLPIGKLTSQLFSNVALDPLDQFAKRTLQEKHYGRYVDDIFFVGTDKACLLSLVEPVKEFLRESLHLAIHPRKVRIQEVRKGISFLGAVVHPGGNTLSVRAGKLMARTLEEAFCFERNNFIVASKTASCTGHVRDKRDNRVEGLMLCRCW